MRSVLEEFNSIVNLHPRIRIKIIVIFRHASYDIIIVCPLNEQISYISIKSQYVMIIIIL